MTNRIDRIIVWRTVSTLLRPSSSRSSAIVADGWFALLLPYCVQYSSNLARASGVARRLATQQIGGVSGRPCSLAEMAIPALAIVVARRHATTHAVLNLLQLEWTSTEYLSTSSTSSRYASGLVHQIDSPEGLHSLCSCSSRLSAVAPAFLRQPEAERRHVQPGPPGRLAGSRVVRRLLDF